MSLLSVERLAVHFGGIRAVKGVDLTVDTGETVCVIGANGAGKSTMLRALAGLAPTAAGRVVYDGHDITGLPVHERARLGLALVPEGRGVFPRMTVRENLLMGAYQHRDGERVEADVAYVHSLFPRLAERRSQVAGTLSGGEQQMLAVGRALMSRPKLLLLDEPSMGLAPLVVLKIFETLRAIAAAATSSTAAASAWPGPPPSSSPTLACRRRISADKQPRPQQRGCHLRISFFISEL